MTDNANRKPVAWQKFVVPVLFVWGAASCITPISTPIINEDCSKVIQPEFREIIGKRTTSEVSIQSWISNTYGVNRSDILEAVGLKSTSTGIVDAFSWSYDNQLAELDSIAGTPFSLWTTWGPSGAPSVAKAFECLDGLPTAYLAQYRGGMESMGPFVEIQALFPGNGTIITFYVPLTDRTYPDAMRLYPLTFDPETTPILGVRTSEPALTTEDLIANYLGDIALSGNVREDQEFKDWVYSRQLPWPDDTREFSYVHIPRP